MSAPVDLPSPRLSPETPRKSPTIPDRVNANVISSVTISEDGKQGGTPVTGSSAPEVQSVDSKPAVFVKPLDENDEASTAEDLAPSDSPPTPPAKSRAVPESPSINSGSVVPDDTSSQSSEPITHVNSSPSTPPHPYHKRSLTVSRGHTVSTVLISTALETISASKEARRSAPLRDSVKWALEMVRSGQGGDRPREIFEPLRLACETRNEKLMIASLDCISKLIAYSFFAETDASPSHQFPSPPPSPGPAGTRSTAGVAQHNMPPSTLVDLVVYTITSCHTETTPESVSLQIVKALLALVLSPTIFVHHSSLLKAVRTVYNVFLLSSDPVNQMVAQGGLTQMVHHVFTRCKAARSGDASTPHSSLPPESATSSTRPSFSERRPESTTLPYYASLPKASDGHAVTSSLSPRFSVESSADPTKSIRSSFDGSGSSNGRVTGAGDVPLGINLDPQTNHET